MIAGYYKFHERLQTNDSFEVWLFHPTVIAYNPDLSIAFEYVETQFPHFLLYPQASPEIYALPTLVSDHGHRS